MLVDEDYRMRLTNLHANTGEDQGKLSVLHNRVQQAEKECENRYLSVYTLFVFVVACVSLSIYLENDKTGFMSVLLSLNCIILK